jgi:hypothetical protein
MVAEYQQQLHAGIVTRALIHHASPVPNRSAEIAVRIPVIMSQATNKANSAVGMTQTQRPDPMASGIIVETANAARTPDSKNVTYSSVSHVSRPFVLSIPDITITINRGPKYAKTN